MTCSNDVKELLPFYAAGTLDETESSTVESHLAACAQCRAELAFWQGVGDVVIAEDASVPAPSTAILERALTRARHSRSSLLERAWQLLCAQSPLVRREIWLTSALVMGLGYLMAILSGQAAGALEAMAPLVAVAGVAMIYGPENDPGLELALATPTSPRQVLLARLVLVFGYDLGLSLVATLGLLAVVPADLLGTVIVNWLGPMALLSSLALVLSLCIGAGNAVAISFVLWLTRWMAKGVIQIPSAMDGQMHPGWLAVAYEQAWTNTLLLGVLAVVLILASVWMVGRQESYLPQGIQAG